MSSGFTRISTTFCAAWSDDIGTAELAAFFTDDAVYHNLPLAPVAGKEAIATTIASFIGPGAPGIESVDFRVIHIAAHGPVVMTERVACSSRPAGRSRCRSWRSSKSASGRSRPGATTST
jgi:limonene-1,2-epoxide hydrolase